MVVRVHFQIPDSELVWVGRCNEQPQGMTAAHAAAHLMSQAAVTGLEVIFPRRIIPTENFGVSRLPQLIGWRHYPDAHGKRPWACECCQKGQCGSRKIRENHAEPAGWPERREQPLRRPFGHREKS